MDVENGYRKHLDDLYANRLAEKKDKEMKDLERREKLLNLMKRKKTVQGIENVAPSDVPYLRKELLKNYESMQTDVANIAIYKKNIDDIKKLLNN